MGNDNALEIAGVSIIILKMCYGTVRNIQRVRLVIEEKIIVCWKI